MISLEQVEALRKHADVSYGEAKEAKEAKEALEATDGDLLDAVIYLEKRGKTEGPQGGGTFRKDEPSGAQQENEAYESTPSQPAGPTCGEQMGKFWKAVCGVIHKGNINHFEVSRNGQCVISVPVTVLILPLFIFWVTVPLLIIGLFFGCSYRFRGPDLGKGAINQVMQSALDTAEKMKASVKKEEGKS